jgi:hypothetical protein
MGGENMSKKSEFISYLKKQKENHSIYAWSGQGQDHNTISEAWIRKMETSTQNANRAIAYWVKQVAAGFGKVLRAFDCSGLGVYWLLSNGLIDRDRTAEDLRQLCDKVSVAKPGDLVFRLRSNGTAFHIGYVVDSELNVIEAKGRDDGVCMTDDLAKNTGYWDEIGRPRFWGTDWEQPTFHITKVLKKGMDDAEVMHITRNLTALGYINRDCTSVFDEQVEDAVKTFQTECDLTADGVVGKKTTEALGGVYEGK